MNKQKKLRFYFFAEPMIEGQLVDVEISLGDQTKNLQIPRHVDESAENWELQGYGKNSVDGTFAVDFDVEVDDVDPDSNSYKTFDFSVSADNGKILLWYMTEIDNNDEEAPVLITDEHGNNFYTPTFVEQPKVDEVIAPERYDISEHDVVGGDLGHGALAVYAGEIANSKIVVADRYETSSESEEEGEA